MIENWRDIPGFEGLYMVSDLGRVRSRFRILRPAYDNRGALIVSLPCKRFKCGHRATKIHLLVLHAFEGPCPTGQVGRHLDGNPYNNVLGNLAYGTHKDNFADRDRHGRTARGEKNGFSTFTEAQIIEIRNHPRYKGYQQVLTHKYGVSQSAISQVVTRRTWRHL